MRLRVRKTHTLISTLVRQLRTFYNLVLSKLNLALNGHQKNSKRSVRTLLFGASSDDIFISNAIKNAREGKWEIKSRQWEVEGRDGRRKWKMIEEGYVTLRLGAEMLGRIKEESKFERKSIHWLIWERPGLLLLILWFKPLLFRSVQ